MMSGGSIKELIQGLQTHDVSFEIGTVTSISPVKIQSVSDKKLLISGAALVISDDLTDREIEMDISCDDVECSTESAGAHTHAISDSYTGGGSSSSAGTHTHAITKIKLNRAKVKIYSGLKVGDRVQMLSIRRQDGGMLYYVLGREAV